MRLSRRRLKRIWYAGLISLWLFPFVLIGAAVADSADLSPPGTGQGWFWRDRPVGSQTVTNPSNGEQMTTPDIYTYPISASGQGYGGGLAEADWPGDHMYVGWDSAKKEIEMFSGVAFSFGSTIPFGSVITRFELTVIEHPAGNSPSPHKTTVFNNGSQSRSAMLTQGIVACPWPDFYGGSRAAPMADAKGVRDCSKKVIGQPTIVPPAEVFTPSTEIAWKFDLTSMARNWADENPAFSLEPNPDTDKHSAISWRTVFHQSGYAEGDTAKPGVFASVEWRKGDSEPEEFTEESFGDLSGGSFSPGFESGLVQDLANPAPAPPTNPPLAAGVFEDRSADFWDIPLGAWAAAIVGLMLLTGSGWALQQDPAGDRPPGAASALMRDGNKKAELI